MADLDDLFEVVLEADHVVDLEPGQRRAALAPLLAPLVAPHELDGVLDRIEWRISGAGPLAPLLADPAVTDVLVNGPGEVYVERAGRLERTPVRFGGADELRALALRLVSASGGRIDDGRPIADARLADGSRLHVVLPPLAPDGPLVSIRRFTFARPGLTELVAAGTLTQEQAVRLTDAVASRATIAIAGATGAGKTTLLNALLRAVPEGERTVVIEETRELRLDGLHAVSLVTRPPNLEGRGGVDMCALVRAALRMRPDRIVIGEVRGPEVFDVLAAMSTGHGGSMVTVHARSAAGARERMVELALAAETAWREEALRRAVERAFDVIVHLERGPQGRRVSAIEERA